MPIATFLVEDSLTIRRHLIPALSDLGDAQVMAYEEGELGANQWLFEHARACQLAVVDLFLKDGSGFGVVAACRALTPPLRVVLVSNYATDDMRRRGFALGVDAVFDKSTELEELFAYCLRLGEELKLALPLPSSDPAMPAPLGVLAALSQTAETATS